MIYIIEDNADIAELIGHSLKKDGHTIKIFHNPLEAFAPLKSDRPQLIMLDLMLPQMDGLSVCRYLREKNDSKNLSIIMLTAKGQEEDIVAGLEAGADDYITKPFSPKVLSARVAAVLRRAEKKEEANLPTAEILIMPPLEMNLSKREVFAVDGAHRRKIDLTFTEFEVLLLLIQKKGWVFTRSQIVNAIKGNCHAVTDRSVDVQIVGLRKKLGELDCIETIRGVGYRFKE